MASQQMISNLRREISGAIGEAVTSENLSAAFRGQPTTWTAAMVTRGVISEENAACHDGMAEIARQDEEAIASFLRMALSGNTDKAIVEAGYSDRHKRHRR
jgi:hypothetical protein